MTITELANAVHENAVAHGWWEEQRKTPEILALIHSEWSEALEEARSGRPMAYIVVDMSTCPQIESYKEIIERGADGRYILNGKEYHGKPEGIAVELIDGCIRILDALGFHSSDIVDPDTGKRLSVDDLVNSAEPEDVPEDVPTLVAMLHALTSQVLLDDEDGYNYAHLVTAMSIAMAWVKYHGRDPLKILLEKHEYNKTRPYKHGKKF